MTLKVAQQMGECMSGVEQRKFFKILFNINLAALWFYLAACYMFTDEDQNSQIMIENCIDRI